MDNLELLNRDGDELENVNEARIKTSLEFEISEESHDVGDSASLEKVLVTDKKDAGSVGEDNETDNNEDAKPSGTYSQSDFSDTASFIRPTYIPRFTEVSDTYRMQNDPRPRPRTDTHEVKVDGVRESIGELDPTAECIEDHEVEKVIVTSSSLRESELVDEKLTVLKFSTPVEFVEEPDDDSFVENYESEPQDELLEATENENIDNELDSVYEEEIIEVEKNTELPDPDATFSVVDFSAREISVSEEPLGAYDTEKKEKGSSEFNSPVQRDSFKDRFLDTLMSIRVRLAGALLLLIIVFGMDIATYLGYDAFADIGLGSIPYARAVFDMQFSICIFLFTLPETLRAFKLLAKKQFSPELVNVTSLVVIIANDLIIATNGATNYLTFGALYALQCFSTVIAAYQRTDSEFLTFKLVSRNVAKNVIDKRLTRELPRENLALDGAVDEYNSKTARMFRTVFVSNFFNRASKTCENSLNVATMIGISMGIALVTGTVSFLLDGYSLVSGIQSCAMVFMLSYPVFSILSHKIALKCVSKRAAIEESAFVGESSVYEAADVDVFTYEDTEIFGIEDVSIRKVHLYGKAYNTPKAMKEMYSLFSVIGGPLDFVFSSALDRKGSSAENIIIEDDGVSGMLEGSRICAGTEEYMKRHGVKIPDDDYRTNPSATDSTKVMYGAEDGEVYVKFFIRYSFSEEFTMLLPDLKAKKIVPLIYTRDPNITVELLKVLTLGEDIIRVMKKYVPRTTEEKTYRRIDSGIVTHGDKNSAINMILLAKKYTAFQESLAASELISMIVGAVLAVVLALGDMFVLPATMLALWQVVWCAVLSIRSRLTFQYRHDREESDKEQ